MLAKCRTINLWHDSASNLRDVAKVPAREFGALVVDPFVCGFGRGPETSFRDPKMFGAGSRPMIDLYLSH